MKFFLDTAMVDEIKTANDWGILDGVTTNPSLVYKSARPFKEVVKEIASIVNGPVSAEVTTLTAPEMVKQGLELSKIADNIFVKLPTTTEGVKACKALSAKKIPINATLIFSASQALIMAKAGASFVSPFIGRLDDVSEDGMQLIRDIRQIYDNYDIQTEILTASVRHPMHVVEAAKIGSDIATMPFKVMEQLFHHPLTDIGLDKFMADFKKSKA
ncbi:fructose-6-phosphate aldolase [Candidatus Micrarchaeota archaeon]|nr:fructose-6-phosphate aldolase [Candidatus Micrarchaeota archaeon]